MQLLVALSFIGAVLSASTTTTKTTKSTKTKTTTTTTTVQIATTISAAPPATGTTVPTASPFKPGAGSVAPPTVAARTKTCTVIATGSDDGPSIKAAAQSCSGGGRVVLAGEYTINSFTDLRGLAHVDFYITGTITFGETVAFWQSNVYQYTYQSAAAMWIIGGVDINIYGGGTIDGNGQIWYDGFAANNNIIRPVLLVLDGVNGGAVFDINLRGSPFWNNLVANSTNVIYDNINIVSASTNSHLPKNTDGWDTYKSDNIVIQNSNINNGDDCVSFKPNSTNLVVQGLSCNGSHGISVGSLGQYKGEYDIVQNVYVYNIQMANAENGARIKVWPGATSSSVGTGGGSGRVQNITYDTFTSTNVAAGKNIVLTQCYNESNLTKCEANPSTLTITDVAFKNFYGTSKKPDVGSIECSSAGVCSNISSQNIVISSSGALEVHCLNVDATLLQSVTCIAP
ncbi:hypothetical protein HK100_012230 [Physocladia obscura]|uniref:galacturonan 1,4-alpha-galacturonidase n=1 Tax=Physocladia obscura TaxID=109957 RepID=A0AAD5T104_9FUNG|nr:hypothetical protein HK100_012230 [Physocladia obscura]